MKDTSTHSETIVINGCEEEMDSLSDDLAAQLYAAIAAEQGEAEEEGISSISDSAAAKCTHRIERTSVCVGWVNVWLACLPVQRPFILY